MEVWTVSVSSFFLKPGSRRSTRSKCMEKCPPIHQSPDAPASPGLMGGPALTHQGNQVQVFGSLWCTAIRRNPGINHDMHMLWSRSSSYRVLLEPLQQFFFNGVVQLSSCQGFFLAEGKINVGVKFRLRLEFVLLDQSNDPSAPHPVPHICWLREDPKEERKATFSPADAPQNQH